MGGLHSAAGKPVSPKPPHPPVTPHKTSPQTRHTEQEPSPPFSPSTRSPTLTGKHVLPLPAQAHAPVKAYFAALATFQKHSHTTEGNTRSAFADLIKKCCSPYGWHLVEEYQFKGTGKQPLRADGALVDDLTLVHGLWEAKDTADDLQAEIKKKVAKGYPLTNILFQSPTRAVLYQDNRIALDTPITEPEKLLEILALFFEHRQAHEVDWESAVTRFAEKIPDLARGVTDILAREYDRNATFRENFLSSAELCRQSINPDLSDDAIRKMLVQHLLTERIFRKVFKTRNSCSATSSPPRSKKSSAPSPPATSPATSSSSPSIASTPPLKRPPSPRPATPKSSTSSTPSTRSSSSASTPNRPTPTASSTPRSPSSTSWSAP